MSAGDGFRRVLDAAHTHGRTVRTNGDRQASIQCPAHDDGNPSLSVTAGETRVLLKCHAGCENTDIVAALGLTMADLYDEPKTDDGPDEWVPCARDGHRKIEEYPYRDEFGKTLYSVTRCDHKCFAQWRPDDSRRGGRAWKLGDVRRVPYRLPELLVGISQGDTAWIVEGERDVHAVAKRHPTVTCNSGGAGKFLPEFAAFFTDADVTIVADRDGPGEDHATHITGILLPVVNSLVIMQSAHGKDARDHFTGGGHLGNFIVAAEPKPWTGPNAISSRILREATSR